MVLRKGRGHRPKGAPVTGCPSFFDSSPLRGDGRVFILKNKERIVRSSILIVEDEADIRELVSFNLLREGHQVASVSSGEEALAMATSRPFDLVLLDLMLPGVDGLSVCQRLKSEPETQNIPIVMLTAKGEESDIIAGLNLGADDYVSKPFSPRVLLARIDAVMRRATVTKESNERVPEEKSVKIHELVIFPKRHQVTLSGQRVSLTSTEFRVLDLLAARPGWVFTRQQILDGVHGDNYAITDRAVDVQIVGLRKKLGSAGRYIETVRGVGYRLRD